MAKKAKDKVSKSKSKAKKVVGKGKPLPSKSKKKAKKSKVPAWIDKKTGVPKKGMLKYLRKDGKRRKNKNYPKGVKSKKQLWEFIKKCEKRKEPWYNPRTCELRAEMLKYYTKDGKRRKGVKLPEGCKTKQDVWDFIVSGKIKNGEDSRLECTDNFMPYWEFKEYVTKEWSSFRKVFMEGVRISKKTYRLYGSDYINLVTDFDASPPIVEYTICKFKDKYYYLFF